MRRVLVVEYPLTVKELPSEKHLSEIVGLINSSLLISHSLRRDTTLHLALDDGVLTVEGRYLKNYRPDYLSARGLIVKCLEGKLKRGMIYRENLDLEKVLSQYKPQIKLVVGEGGEGIDMESYAIPSNINLVLVLFPQAEVVMKGFSKIRILPPRTYSVDQKIVIVQNWLDRVVGGWNPRY